MVFKTFRNMEAFHGVSVTYGSIVIMALRVFVYNTIDWRKGITFAIMFIFSRWLLRKETHSSVQLQTYLYRKKVRRHREGTTSSFTFSRHSELT